jgi:lipoprotein-anchoring transpeptidase ErfK/SrfK
VVVVMVVVTMTLLPRSALAASAAEVAARTAAAVPGTPCTATASACVDLATQQAWLIDHGVVVRGPVPVATGGAGEETAPGNVFRVYRKDRDFASTEFSLPDGRPAPMPYSVFFEDGGIAFHAGDPTKASAGCVHLRTADAKAFYAFLRIGEHVQVKTGTSGA